DPGEACDDGPENGAYTRCLADCSGPGPACGDGIVDEAFGEVCDDGINDHAGGGCLPGCQAEDRSDEIFSRDLVRIDITLDPAEWEVMRVQRKTRASIFEGEDCRTRQVPNPYTWFSGTVTIDGEEVHDVGLRKKGHLGSHSTTKPSMKLQFDRFVEDQRFHTMTRFAINNSRGDPTYMRSCLSYRVFQAAGIPAPRCTYARVSVNGVDRGVYFLVEEVKKPFLRRHLPDDDGNLYEGTACDFRPEFFGGFEQETNEQSDPSRMDLQAVNDIVQNTPDELLEGALDAVVNLDRFFRYWAVESLIWHRDGYSGNANNYFVYADPADGGRFMWLPWGPDAAFQADNRANVPDSVMASGAMTFRLYQNPPTQARYHEALLAALDDVWDVEDLAAEAARVAAIITPELPAGERAAYANQVAGITQVIRGRRQVIEDVLAAGPPRWTAGMRSLPCRIAVAPIAGTLQTTWGTLNQNIYASGAATLELTLDGVPVVATRSGATIGRLGSGQGRAQFNVDSAAGERFRFVITFPDPRFNDPYETLGDHELISPQLTTTVIHEDISGQNARRLHTWDIGEGTWTFDAVGTSPGDRVEVRFQGTLYRGVE
ncbi:MAG: CotH kinase family protein, partial [Myxococcales bacterium]|nr:CotH kinase family protein [Myxococcales bacterium]